MTSNSVVFATFLPNEEAVLLLLFGLLRGGHLRVSLRRKEMRVKARKPLRNEGSRRFKSAPLPQAVLSFPSSTRR
jgi:hypothetical protein